MQDCPDIVVICSDKVRISMAFVSKVNIPVEVGFFLSSIPGIATADNPKRNSSESDKRIRSPFCNSIILTFRVPLEISVEISWNDSEVIRTHVSSY